MNYLIFTNQVIESIIKKVLEDVTIDEMYGKLEDGSSSYIESRHQLI